MDILALFLRAAGVGWGGVGEAFSILPLSTVLAVVFLIGAFYWVDSVPFHS